MLFVSILGCFWFVCQTLNKPKFWHTNQNSEKQTKILANNPNLFGRSLVCLPRLILKNVLVIEINITVNNHEITILHLEAKTPFGLVQTDAESSAFYLEKKSSKKNII